MHRYKIVTTMSRLPTSGLDKNKVHIVLGSVLNLGKFADLWQRSKN